MALVPQRIEAARVGKRMSRDHLARLVSATRHPALVGVNGQTIYRWERRGIRPRYEVDAITAIAHALDKPFSHFYETDEPEPAAAEVEDPSAMFVSLLDRIVEQRVTERVNERLATRPRGRLV